MINKFRRTVFEHPPSDRFVAGKAEALLVSFCNMTMTSEAPLAIVDLSNGSYKWLGLNGLSADKGLPSHGTRALCWHEGLVCVAYKLSRDVAEMALYDPYDGYRVKARFPSAAGIHSAVSRDGDIYMTNSLEDTVYRARPDRRGAWQVGRVWTMPHSTGEYDECHINGISLIEGRLCVSGLGRKETRSPGFVYDIEAERYVYDDVHGPHSLLWDGEKAWTCASVNNQVLTLDGETHQFPTTYLRGLVIDDEGIYAGSSKRRTRSLSKGTATGVSKKRRGECSLWRKRRDGEPERLVDFSKHRHEVYDLLPIPALRE